MQYAYTMETFSPLKRPAWIYIIVCIIIILLLPGGTSSSSDMLTCMHAYSYSGIYYYNYIYTQTCLHVFCFKYAFLPYLQDAEQIILLLVLLIIIMMIRIRIRIIIVDHLQLPTLFSLFCHLSCWLELQ